LLLGQSTKGGFRNLVSKLFSRKQLIKKIEKNQKGLVKVGAGKYHILENRFLLEKDFYEEYSMLPFEGIPMRVPTQYDKYLTRCYGDYMQLPPEEKRVPLHSTNHLSADMSYKEYIEKYLEQ
jgi:lipopolysaccharide cholinephosphotransferase